MNTFLYFDKELIFQSVRPTTLCTEKVCHLICLFWVVVLTDGL